jgi:predicted metalloprotease with PDZ domain
MSFAFKALVLAVAPVSALPALAQMQSAPVIGVRYELTFNQETAARREVGVRMIFDVVNADPVLLSFPVWTPGAYEVSNFARNVLRFQVTQNDRPLDWDKLDYDTWRIMPAAGGTVTVRFDYTATSLDNAMAWTAEDFLLVNGTNVLPYPEGRPLDFAAELSVITEPDWRVATGMTPGGAPRAYRAASYHDLVDMPLFVGRLDVDSQVVDGRWHRLVTYPPGKLAGSRRTAFWRQIEAMVPPMSAVFGETPFDSYTTLILFRSDFPGASALEHQNSHVGIYSDFILQASAFGHELLASITAHEIFHAWNVKRLRPAEMVPYEYSRPQPTTLLWVSEGITDHYADLALVRGKISSEQDFYQQITQKVRTVAEAPPVALEDASLTTWIGPQDGTGYVYYPKGSLAGLLLDILIRDGSDNRASLDAVLRDLYQATFKRGRGFTVEEFWQAASRAAGGRSFADFAERYVDGREPFPYRETLALGGLMLRVDSTRVPRLGVETREDSLGVRIARVAEGGAAAEAGVLTGDYLVRVGDVEVAGGEFGEEFRNRYASAASGAPLPVVVRRGGTERTLTARIRFETVTSETVVRDDRAAGKAARIRQGILTGR